MNHGIIIHPEDFEDLLKMDALEAGHIVQNMIKTFKGESVVPFSDRYLTRVSNDMCGRVLRDKELSERQSAKGKRGGGQFGNTNAKRTETNQKRAENEPKTSRKRTETNPNTKTNTNTKTNIYKKTYGECANVKLTDEEYQKLKDKNLTHLIDELSLYIASKGDKYKSHYATILGWSRKREKESSPKVNQFTSGAKGADYDFEEILKRKVVN